MLSLKPGGAPADLPFMDAEFLPNLLGNVVNLVALGVFVAGVMKVFQIAVAINEIRDAVKDIRRSQDLAAPGSGSAPNAASLSGDEMLRALDAELHLAADPEPIKPEIVNPR